MILKFIITIHDYLFSFPRVFCPQQVFATQPKFLGDLLDFEKKHRPVKLVRSRVCSKAVELLFRELVKEICKLDME